MLAWPTSLSRSRTCWRSSAKNSQAVLHPVPIAKVLPFHAYRFKGGMIELLVEQFNSQCILSVLDVMKA